MARRLRLQFPGAIYHVINRGNYRRDLFATSGAAKSFELALGEASSRYGWVIHAFAAMRNHFHLALTTPLPNLSEGMHWLQTTFAVRFNRFRCASGHLFQGRYQSPLIEDAGALARVVDYIHLNPVRAGSVPANQPAAFPFGSLGRFVHGPRPAWLSAREWLAELQIEDSPAGWVKYVHRLGRLMAHPDKKSRQESEEIARGRPIGTDAWKRALAHKYRLRALEQDLPHEESLPLKQARWAAAFRAALASRGVIEADIAWSHGISPWKLEVASRIRRASGAPWRWIAERLRLDNPGSLRAAVCWLDRR